MYERAIVPGGAGQGSGVSSNTPRFVPGRRATYNWLCFQTDHGFSPRHHARPVSDRVPPRGRGDGRRCAVPATQSSTATPHARCCHRLSVGGQPMRNRFLLTVVCFLALPLAVQAQDQAEYIHWDAASLQAFHDQLTKQLSDDPDSGLAFTDALARSDARHHYVQVIHRRGYSRPEIHPELTDVYVILGGSRHHHRRWRAGRLGRWSARRIADSADRRRTAIPGCQRGHPQRSVRDVAPDGVGAGRIGDLRHH